MSNPRRMQSIKIDHPLVKDAYLKKHLITKDHAENVLVLETYTSKEYEKAGMHPHIADILQNLHLKDPNMQKCGSIDRIDIVRH